MVFVHLAEGFEEIEAITILDILRRGGLPVCFVSMGSEKIVRGAHGILVEGDIIFEDAIYQSCTMIVLPGGMPGTKNLLANDGLLAEIRNFEAQGKYLAAICAAPMVLSAVGVLKGKRATIYPGMEAHLKDAILSTERVVMDGKVITSRGPGTSIEFALKIVEVFKGVEATNKLRKDLVV